VRYETYGYLLSRRAIDRYKIILLDNKGNLSRESFNHCRRRQRICCEVCASSVLDAGYCCRRRSVVCQFVSVCWSRPRAPQERLDRSRSGSAGLIEPCIGWGPGSSDGRGTCTRHPLDSGHVQSSRPLDATNSTQQKRNPAAMRAVAIISVATLSKEN